jgi:WD40 repeat protein
LWDLRINSSIKQFKDPLFAENSASNAKMSPDGSRLYVGAGQNILEFDLKTEKILIDKSVRNQEKTRDEINFVTVSPNGKFLASCDDSGDIQIYDPETLDTYASFKDNHKNVLNLRYSA